MSLPDTSNVEQMAHVGRLTVLRKARREAAQKLRDKLIPLINSIEARGKVWDVSGVLPLVEEIEALSGAIEKLEEGKHD